MLFPTSDLCMTLPPPPANTSPSSPTFPSSVHRLQTPVIPGAPHTAHEGICLNLTNRVCVSIKSEIKIKNGEVETTESCFEYKFYKKA